MANIKVNDIEIGGLELFVDSESFLNFLDDNDIGSVVGGGSCITSAYTCNGLDVAELTADVAAAE